jgi:dynein heavy chain 1
MFKLRPLTTNSANCNVLDDNKLLTLPNGPPNLRIMFEVEHLRYATLATISRCGMIWFSEDVVVPDMVYDHYIQTLRSIPLNPARRG